MDEKENAMKRALKRKSCVIDSSIQSKRINISLNESISENETSFSSQYMGCDTPALTNVNPYSSCLTDSFKNGITLNQAITPISQILPLSEFKKLPKPDYVNSEESMKEPFLDQSLSDSISSLSPFNDSFEVLKPKLHRCKTYNPVTSGHQNTPETPCGLHDIDLDNMDDSLSFDYCFNVPSMHRQLSVPLKSVQVSPIFYEHDVNLRPQIKVNPSERYISTTVMKYNHNNEIENKIEELNADLVKKIIENDYTSKSYVYYIIDCRYPYEYDGGHIDGAVNLYTPYQLLNYVFLSKYDVESPIDPEKALKELVTKIRNLKRPPPYSEQKAFIFHCEFSSIRGPEMARCLRSMDRMANIENYPQIYFPKVFVMAKGYKDFYSKYKELCKPIDYVTMEIRDPDRQDCDEMDGESEDEVAANVIPVDRETIQRRVKMYNLCKRETLNQMRIFSQLVIKTQR